MFHYTVRYMSLAVENTLAATQNVVTKLLTVWKTTAQFLDRLGDACSVVPYLCTPFLQWAP